MLKNALALTLVAATVLPATAVTVEAQTSRRYSTTDDGIRYWRGNDGRYYCTLKSLVVPVFTATGLSRK